MPTLKLSEKSIAKLPAPDPSGKQVCYWDADLKGFAALVSGVSNSKSYIVQHAVATGRKRRVTIGACNVLKFAAARDRAKEVLADFFRGIDPKGGRNDKCTLRAALDDYLEARKNLAPATRKNYRNRVEAYLSAWLDLPLRVITPEMVEQRHRSIAAENKRSGFATATANDAMTMLGILWKHMATAVPTLPRNPTDRLKGQWFAVQRRTGIVKADDLPRFYAAVMALPDEVLRDYIRLLLFTGLRKSEAASLRWADVDFTAKVIRIPGDRTKTKIKLDLPMTDVLFGLFVDRSNRGREGEYIFPAKGQQIDPRLAFEKIAAACGIDITAHDLRRTFLTVAESCEISQLALKALANHSLGNDVTAGYVMMTAQRLAAPAQRVADRMRELCGIAKVEAANVKRLRGA